MRSRGETKRENILQKGEKMGYREGRQRVRSRGDTGREDIEGSSSGETELVDTERKTERVGREGRHIG